MAFVLLMVAPAAAPPAEAAGPGSCTSSAAPLPVGGVAFTLHTLVNMPVCSASASCTGCTTMSASITVEGLGLVSGQMLAGGAGGQHLVGCAGLNRCTGSVDVTFVSFTFYCEGSSGELLEVVNRVPTVALGVNVTCEAG